MFDASTAQFCPRYIRGQNYNEINDLYYRGLFQAFRQMNVLSRGPRKIKALLAAMLKTESLTPRMLKLMIANIMDLINESFVANRTNRFTGGLLEDVSIDGVIYMVPIFAISKNTSLSKNTTHPRIGLVIYDDMMPGLADEKDIRSSLLFNITVYALAKYNLNVDFVEYFIKTSGGPKPTHKKHLLTNISYNYGLLQSYARLHKNGVYNIYQCNTCINKTICWGQDVKNN